jgi:hypothetical protein
VKCDPCDRPAVLRRTLSMAGVVALEKTIAGVVRCDCWLRVAAR